MLHANVSAIKLLARPVLLQAVREVKCFVQFISLEYVNATAENNLPSMAGGDIAIMFSPRGVIFPSKLNANAQAGVGDLLKIFCLTLTVIVVCGRYLQETHVSRQWEAVHENNRTISAGAVSQVGSHKFCWASRLRVAMAHFCRLPILRIR